MPRQYSACLARVSGSKPPTTFLDELVDWALLAPDELFLPNAAFDAYSAVAPQLGPYRAGAHRKAVMLEVLRCLAGLETMWDWNHGVDGNKTEVKTSHTEEAGAFQCSATSLDLDKSLMDYARATLGATDDATFISGTKSNHAFAIEYAVRLLRITIRHYGPFVNSKSIFGALSRNAAQEFKDKLEIVGDFSSAAGGAHYA